MDRSLKYSNFLSIRFKPREGESKDTTLTKRSLQNEFGENNVIYDFKTDLYKIPIIKMLLLTLKARINEPLQLLRKNKNSLWKSLFLKNYYKLYDKDFS